MLCILYRCFYRSHVFMGEVMTVVRAYVAAIGGNALSSLRIQQHSMPEAEGVCNKCNVVY